MEDISDESFVKYIKSLEFISQKGLLLEFQDYIKESMNDRG